MNNNHEMMNTVVETFIIEETAPLVYDGEQLEKWNKLIVELGLNGQKALKKPEKSPIPFMHLKKNMSNVLSTLCPVKQDVKDYNKTPIPLEIMELIALAKREEYFDTLQIWYDDKQPDPCCIGTIKMWGVWNDYRYQTKEEAVAVHGDNIGPYSYEHVEYLLGKWADVKQSFEELADRAIARWIKERRADIEKSIKQYERELSDLRQNAEERFNI